LTAAVFAAMANAAATEIMPRWRSLVDGDVRTKTADWDVVTDADVFAEKQLTVALRELLDISVVGEEATSANPSLADLVAASDACWLVDPVDGTRNFVAGREDFACMVALVVAGRTVGAWITHPAVSREIWGALGQGTFIDGERVTAPAPSDPSAPRGAIGARLFMDDADAVYRRAEDLGPVVDLRFCAGWDYYDMLTGAKDYVVFSRSLPWDHAPGGLLVEEAGLRIGRFDGSEYLPGDARKGLLTAHPSVWDVVRDGLGLA
jgi:fructose-1,6-bisphosphatase/inositol monophosphatase family enzyme